jgi:RHS repeat-associated protein
LLLQLLVIEAVRLDLLMGFLSNFLRVPFPQLRLILCMLGLQLIFWLSFCQPSYAGKWFGSHSCSNSLVWQEGEGGAAALNDQRCAFPESAGPACTSNGFFASCFSIYNNNDLCVYTFGGKQYCGGQASHLCNPDEDFDKVGNCIKKDRLRDGTCGPQAGNPVEILTGTKVQDFVDWSSGGVHPLQFVRSYASSYNLLQAPDYSRFSKAWRSNFDARASYIFQLGNTVPSLARDSDGIYIVLPDSVEYNFVFYAGVWQSRTNRSSMRSDMDLSLTASADSVDLRVQNGTHYVFDINGLLTKIVAPDGYAQSLSYVSGYNTKVTDSLGRSLSFQYDTDLARQGLLSSVATSDGKTFNYSYSNRIAASLQNVAGLWIWALDTVTYPDNTPTVSTDNPKRIYQYLNNPDFPFALTGITDERGILYASWSYDAQGRAITSEHAGGVDRYSFSYDDINNKVTVTNPLGKATVYNFQIVQGQIRRIISVDGIVTSSCAASNTAYTYDANGFRNQATDAEGRITQWTKNARGLATTTIAGVGTPVARTTTMSWDPIRPLPTQIIGPGLTTNIAYNSAGNITQLSQVDTTSTTLPYVTTGQTRVTDFGYTSFTIPAPPVVAPTGTALSDVALSIVNPGAETGTASGWTVVNSNSPLGVQTPGVLDGRGNVHPCTVTKCFGGTGQTAFTDPQTSMIAYQDILVPAANIAEVDAGKRAARMNWKQISNTDQSTIRLLFLNASGVLISTATPSFAAATIWTAREKIMPVPVGTRTIRMQITVPNFHYWFTGSWYIDDIALALIANGSASAKPFLMVANSDAGTGTTGWTTVSGGVTTSTSGPCATISCFTDTSAVSDQISQDIAIPSDRYTEVDNLARMAEVQWMDQTSSTNSATSLQVDFLNASNAIISGTSLSSPSQTSPGIWVVRTSNADVPVGARKIRLTIKFNHSIGSPITWDYAYLTDITLRLIGRVQQTGSINLLTSVDGPLAGVGDKVTYAYDTKGNLAQITDQVGLISKVLSVDLAGRPTSIQNENGVNTNLAYDARDRLTTITVNPGAAQAVTSLAYDLAGDVTTLTLPDGALFTYTWNDAKRLTSVSNFSNERIDYSYNFNGDVTSATTKIFTGAIHRQMNMAYDELGRLLRQVGAATQTTTLSYDRTDNLTQVKDPRNGLYGYAYDGLSRLVRSSDQQAAQVTVTRDGQDNVTAYADPRLITTNYVRNGFGEVIQEQSPDAGTTVYVRDARGLVTQMTGGRGVVSTMTYDTAGRLLTVAYPAAPAENVTYAYDAVLSGNKGKGRLTSIVDQSGSTAFAYDVLGRVTSNTRVIAGKTYVVAYVYSTTGKVLGVTYPSGRQLLVSQGGQRQPAALTTKLNAAAAAQNVATAIARKPMSDLVTTITHGNGLVTSATYDLDYRLTGLNLKNGTAVISGSTYAYADTLNLTGITDQVTAANSNSLSYSATNRLATASGAWGNAAYSYDAVGNRLSDVVTGSLNLNHQSTIDSFSNRLTSMTENAAAFRSYTYDGAGNIATDVRPGETYLYTYNNRNRLASVTRNAVAYASYSYNALEQLTTRVTSAPAGPLGTIAYIYDLDGHLIVEADAATGATLREYLWLPANDNRLNLLGGSVGQAIGLASFTAAANDNASNSEEVDLPLAIVDTVNTTPTLLMVHTDHLGRPIRLTDATKATVWQATYKPWGETQSISGTRSNNLRFPGQYFQIETNLAYNWHRHYDPVTGRYTQPDPLRFVDGPSVYAYANSSPWMKTDRSGRELDGGARPANCGTDPNWLIGLRAHNAFNAAILANNANVNFSLNNGFSGLFSGRPDVFQPSTGKVWELKPTSHGSGSKYGSALTQLRSYIRSSNTNRSPMGGYSPMTTSGDWGSLFGGSPTTSSGGFNFYPDNPAYSGIVFYDCTPEPEMCTINEGQNLALPNF